MMLSENFKLWVTLHPITQRTADLKLFSVIFIFLQKNVKSRANFFQRSGTNYRARIDFFCANAATISLHKNLCE